MKLDMTHQNVRKSLIPVEPTTGMSSVTRILSVTPLNAPKRYNLATDPLLYINVSLTFGKSIFFGKH